MEAGGEAQVPAGAAVFPLIPAELGGGGFTDVFTQCLVQEELCWGDPGIGNLLSSNGFFASPVRVLVIQTSPAMPTRGTPVRVKNTYRSSSSVFFRCGSMRV